MTPGYTVCCDPCSRNSATDASAPSRAKRSTGTTGRVTDSRRSAESASPTRLADAESFGREGSPPRRVDVRGSGVATSGARSTLRGEKRIASDSQRDNASAERLQLYVASQLSLMLSLGSRRSSMGSKRTAANAFVATRIIPPFLRSIISVVATDATNPKEDSTTQGGVSGSIFASAGGQMDIVFSVSTATVRSAHSASVRTRSERRMEARHDT